MPHLPNILWICTDSQRNDTLGCYGNRLVRFALLQQLAERMADAMTDPLPQRVGVF